MVFLLFTTKTVKEGKELNDEITNVSSPSVKRLEDLKSYLEQSKTLIIFWGNVQSENDRAEKRRLKSIMTEDLPLIKGKINSLENSWESDKDRELKKAVYSKMNKLFKLYREVQSYLPGWDHYDEGYAFDRMIAMEMVEEDGAIDELYDELLVDLNQLIANQREESKTNSNEMISSFENLKTNLTYLGIGLILCGMFIAWFTTRSITSPVHRLKGVIQSLGTGVIPKEEIEHSNDEIGDMTEALNTLMGSLKRTRDFASATGTGNFEVDYELLGPKDEMGMALLRMRDGLAENERELEAKVEQRTIQLQKKSDELQEKNVEIEELYEDVTASIRYAKRIQDSILPSNALINEMFDECFVLYKPKDIVSGDFYWFLQQDGKKYFAAVDCTGHGVPGAFMSLIAYTSINQIIKEYPSSDPGEILSRLNDVSISGLNRQMEDLGIKDGMDMSLCVWDEKTNELAFAGAGRPIYYFKDGDLGNIKGDRYAIGNSDYLGIKFETKKIKLSKGDMVYQFSDGYVDQFGGETEHGTKFKHSRFRPLLKYIYPMSMDEQREELDKAMLQWQGGIHEQIDDILVIGVRF
ncbi:MAG: SpoIIE family protein phosphatase [Flavobacteriales bacterium]|nr:SpoIIE family protein phosphatase [Flavobacteriales bacterium]